MAIKGVFNNWNQGEMAGMVVVGGVAQIKLELCFIHTPRYINSDDSQN